MRAVHNTRAPTSPPLGRDPSTLPQWPSVRWFTTDYGCLRLDLDEGGTVVSVSAHAQACAEVAVWYGAWFDNNASLSARVAGGMPRRGPGVGRRTADR